MASAEGGSVGPPKASVLEPSSLSLRLLLWTNGGLGAQLKSCTLSLLLLILF